MDTNHKTSSQHSEVISKTRNSISSNTKTENIKNSTENKGLTRKPIIIRLEPSLGEKLAKKRAVASELEDKLQKLREKFDEKIILAERTKNELHRRETQLLQSVQKIEGYMQEIYALKRVAEDMYERFGEIVKESETHEQSLLEECIDVSQKRNTAFKLLEIFQPAKVYLEDLVYYDFPELSSARDLVEYTLVLSLLKKDLLREDKRRGEQEENVALKRQMAVERARVHPMLVLGREDALHRTKAEIKDIHAGNVELQRQVDSAMSAKVKDNLFWYDTERWIDKLNKSTREALPPQSEDRKGGTLEQLQDIYDFVVMGTKIINKLKEANTV